MQLDLLQDKSVNKNVAERRRRCSSTCSKTGRSYRPHSFVLAGALFCRDLTGLSSGRRASVVWRAAIQKRAEALLMARAGARRCTECRCWFHPGRCAPQQRVCGSECRKARRRKLARRRRGRAPFLWRADERVRQQASREARRQKGCHAPPSAAKRPDLLRKVQQIVDSAFELSRATLERGLPRILAGSAALKWTEITPADRLSRATIRR